MDWAGQSQVVTKISLTVHTDNLRAGALYECKGLLKESMMGM